MANHLPAQSLCPQELFVDICQDNAPASRNNEMDPEMAEKTEELEREKKDPSQKSQLDCNAIRRIPVPTPESVPMLSGGPKHDDSKKLDEEMYRQSDVFGLKKKIELLKGKIEAAKAKEKTMSAAKEKTDDDAQVRCEGVEPPVSLVPQPTPPASDAANADAPKDQASRVASVEERIARLKSSIKSFDLFGIFFSH